MCTAITRNVIDTYFGRTLDVEVDYKTQVVICPRNFKFNNDSKKHYAIIGMALVLENYPLFFDATNEYGLSMAGLNFPGNAQYFNKIRGKNNLAVYELIPYILGQCKNVKQAKKEFENINIISQTFNNIPNTPLHWIVSDSEKSITIEQTNKGLIVYDNPVGVLANNPTFDWHMTNLINYLNITPEEANNRFLNQIDLQPFCKGMGGIGLPGDLSSPSRFVRATFAKNRALNYESEEKNVCQFFHILDSVEQTTGLAKAGKSYEQTLYTSCCNASKGIYYYKTYFNSQIRAVDMHKIDLNVDKLAVYPLNYEPNFEEIN